MYTNRSLSQHIPYTYSFLEQEYRNNFDFRVLDGNLIFFPNFFACFSFQPFPQCESLPKSFSISKNRMRNEYVRRRRSGCKLSRQTEQNRTEPNSQGLKVGENGANTNKWNGHAGRGWVHSQGCWKKGCFVIRYEYFNVVYFISFQLVLREGCKLFKNLIKLI